MTRGSNNPIRKILVFLLAGIFLNNMEINSAECVNGMGVPGKKIEISPFFKSENEYDLLFFHFDKLRFVDGGFVYHEDKNRSPAGISGSIRRKKSASVKNGHKPLPKKR